MVYISKEKTMDAMIMNMTPSSITFVVDGTEYSVSGEAGVGASSAYVVYSSTFHKRTPAGDQPVNDDSKCRELMTRLSDIAKIKGIALKFLK
jgi:hypothetical protein